MLAVVRQQLWSYNIEETKDQQLNPGTDWCDDQATVFDRLPLLALGYTEPQGHPDLDGLPGFTCLGELAVPAGPGGLLDAGG